MKILGLTGGIGSGKSTVAGFFKELGVPVYIADVEAKRIMENDIEVKRQIIELFGEDAYKDGLPDRKLIASKVFNDKPNLEKLNSIIHPAVSSHFELWKKEQYAAYIVYEAAILFEKGGYKKCDLNLLITAPMGEKLKRLQKRDNATLDEIQARMDNQWTDKKKKELSDFVIENIDLSNTRTAVRQLHETLLKSA